MLFGYLLTEGGMPVTMSRLNLVKGLGPVLQIAEGAPSFLQPFLQPCLPGALP
jgi:L-fucose isomerase